MGPVTGLERLDRAHSIASNAIGNAIGWKFEHARDVVDLEVRLFERYARTGLARSFAGIGPRHNVVLVNAISNSLYYGSGSIDHLERGYVGPARCLHRPWFEGLLIAKESTIDASFIPTWQAEEEGNEDRSRISVHHDIFATRGFDQADGPVNALVSFWRELHNFIHHTRHAGQAFSLLHFPAPGSKEGDSLGFEEIPKQVKEWVVHLKAQVEHGIDATFALLDMTAHVITPHLRKKGRSFRRRYGEQQGVNVSEKELRDELRSKISKYWDKNEERIKGLNDQWERLVRGYRQSWDLSA